MSVHAHPSHCFKLVLFLISRRRRGEGRGKKSKKRRERKSKERRKRRREVTEGGKPFTVLLLLTVLFSSLHSQMNHPLPKALIIIIIIIIIHQI